MKSKLKFVLTALVVVSSIGGLTSCDNSSSDKKIGVILVGDETEGYTEAHIKGIEAAAEKLNISSDNIIYKKKVAEDSNCTTAINDLHAEGCNLIVSNSYGHEDFMCTGAKSYTDTTFISMTGDYAAISGCSNFKNAFVNIYEARYVSGVVAGMKLKELIDGGKLDDTFNKDSDGNWKVGYVGAYNYAEVVSGYTSFFLGVKSIVSNVAMTVKFTNSWFDIDKEGSAADVLVKSGCVIIGQHADSTGAPAKVQSLLGATRTDNSSKKYVCYSVGFNIDMIPTAADAALTSAINNWEVYYEYAFKQYLNDGTIDTDWSKGYADSAVSISTLNSKSVPSGTAEKVAEVEANLKNGTLHVFDTSNFTVGGEKVTSAKINLSYMDYSGSTPKVVYEGETKEAIVTSGSTSYFSESTLRSAPYFSLAIDGIDASDANK